MAPLTAGSSSKAALCCSGPPRGFCYITLSDLLFKSDMCLAANSCLVSVCQLAKAGHC